MTALKSGHPAPCGCSSRIAVAYSQRLIGGRGYDAETISQNLHFIQMNGREVFRFATRVMGRAAKEVIQQANLKIDDVELFIPHQANSRIIESASKSLKVDDDRVYRNLQRYGNTSAASIPIALCEAIEENLIKPSDHLVLVGFGGGLTWGALVIKW